MPGIVVLRQVDMQVIKIRCETIADNTTYGNLMVSAVREARNLVNQAIIKMARVSALLDNGDPHDLSDAVLELLQTYFCLPAAAPANIATYRATVRRIRDLLNRIAPGIARSGLTFQKIAPNHLAQGFQGIIIPSVWERLGTWQGDDDQHNFSDTKDIASDVYLRYQLLTSNWDAAVNTIIHECTHKFAHTVDHCYFNNWGLHGQRLTHWLAVAMARTFVAINCNYWAVTPQNQQTKQGAIAAIKVAMAASLNIAANTLQNELAVARLLRDIDIEVQQRMANYLNTNDYQNLNNVRALNNADSYSNFIVSLPNRLNRYER